MNSYGEGTICAVAYYFIFFTTLLVGQTTFATTEIAGGLVQAESVFLADIDNDGDLDVVSATEDDKIHYMKMMVCKSFFYS